MYITCIYIYKYMYTYTYISTHTYKHMYLHAHAYTCIYGVDEPGDLEHGISAYTHMHICI